MLGEFLPESMLPEPAQRLVTSLFLGTALSISSVKIVAMVVREMGFMRRNVGQVIIASAIIDDTIGWIIIAVIFGLALHGTVDLRRWPEACSARWCSSASASPSAAGSCSLIRWTNDNLVSEVPVITMILVVMGLWRCHQGDRRAHRTGRLHRRHPGRPVADPDPADRRAAARPDHALFMPVFFGLAGLGADLTILKDPNLLLLTMGLVLIASLGKFGGAFLGGWLGGLTRPRRSRWAAAMNARGSTEVIVATIGLSMGALSQDLFTMIVAMAVVTTMAMPPTLRWALGRLPLRDEERARLEREAFEMEGFETNLERLLVAVDGSPKSRFAVRLAGLLAGSRGMPVTVLGIGSSLRTSPLSMPDGADVAVEDAQEFEADTRKAFPPKVKLLTRVSEAPLEEAVADEARKGYGLLIVGVERSADISGGFHEDVARMASGFRGPLAVAVARGAHADRPLDADLRILIPITGTDVSRRGAEVGLALARATNAPAMALHIAGSVAKPARRRFGRSRRGEDEILRHIVGLADGYGVPLRTTTRVDLAAEDAILRQARLGGHNLIVMGVTRRPGESLFFGTVATAILESSERSILFVAS